VDTDLLVTAVDAIQEEQQEHLSILQALEQRKIVELDGVERRLDEVADAMDRVQQTVSTRLQQRRAWWRTPAYVTLAFVSGMLVCYGMLVWLTQQQLAAINKTLGPKSPAVAGSPTAGKKGR